MEAVRRAVCGRTPRRAACTDAGCPVIPGWEAGDIPLRERFWCEMIPAEHLDLPPQVITRHQSALWDLISMNRESVAGFTRLAATIDDEEVSRLATDQARIRRQQADELASIIDVNVDEVEPVPGRFGMAVHQAWEQACAAMQSRRIFLVLTQALRAETFFARAYSVCLRFAGHESLAPILRKHAAQSQSLTEALLRLREPYWL